MLRHALVGSFSLGVVLATMNSFLFYQNNIYSICRCIAYILCSLVLVYCFSFLVLARKSLKELRANEFQALAALDELCSLDLITKEL